MFHSLLVLAIAVGLVGCGEKTGPPSPGTTKPKANAGVLDIRSSSNTMFLITSTTRDEDIRAALLSHTPIGTAATNVLKFVVDELRAEAHSYYRFVDALESTRTGRVAVVRVDPGRPAILPEGSSWEQPHEIYAALGAYPDGSIPCIVAANWKFDAGDKLAELTIVKDHSP